LPNFNAVNQEFHYRLMAKEDPGNLGGQSRNRPFPASLNPTLIHFFFWSIELPDLVFRQQGLAFPHRLA
jgi:hypothetical protein